MNDLYAKEVARSGRKSFWKVMRDGPATIISAYPIRPNAVTKVTFFMRNGDTFNIGCGKKNIDLMMTKGDLFEYPNTVFYSTVHGMKYRDKTWADYASRSYAGDNITMTIDLRPFVGEVSYARNGLDMGVAFSGLNDWGTDVYIMFSLHVLGHRLDIVDYSVQE